MDAEEFDEFAQPPDLPNDNDFFNEADLFNDEYNDPEIAELFDGINLTDLAQSTVSAQSISNVPQGSTGQRQLCVIVNRQLRPRSIQQRALTNVLPQMIPTTKVRSKDSPILLGQLFFVFEFIVDPANPVLQNDFGPMTVKCSYCGALYWTVE